VDPSTRAVYRTLPDGCGARAAGVTWGGPGDGVDRRVRSQGVGKALFEWAIARARERGCVMIQITTDKSRPDAKRFYEGRGFVASHEGMKLHFTPRSTG
jgi:GNAT superfamily N-acetyltransferase